MLRRDLHGRPLRHRPEDRLPAGQRRARARPRRPRPRRSRRTCASSCSDAGSRDPARRRAAHASSPRSRRSTPRSIAARDARRPRARRRRRRAPSRCRRSRTPRWTATRCARPTPRRATPVRLRVVGELAGRARADASPVGAGEAIRIMTGAPMPDGADAIVMVERTHARRRRRRDRRSRASPASTCRPPGGDLDAGDAVFEPGTVLDARAHRRAREPRRRRGARATRGRASVCCSTGDELVERGPLAPGRSATRTGRCCSPSLAEAGFEPVDYGIARDDEDEIARAHHRRGRRVRRAAHERRGVGRRLRLREGRARAARRDAAGQRVRVVAGRDQAGEAARVRRRSARVPVFGLPGNPVSSRVSFELFARPALRRMAGRADRRAARSCAATAAHRVRAAGPTASCTSTGCASSIEDGRYVVRAAGVQASNVLSGMAAANGLALHPRRRRRRRGRRGRGAPSLGAVDEHRSPREPLACPGAARARVPTVPRVPQIRSPGRARAGRAAQRRSLAPTA